MTTNEDAEVDPHVTGYQFSNLWLRIEGENAIGLEMDDGTAISLTTVEAGVLADRILNLLHTHEDLFGTDAAS